MKKKEGKQTLRGNCAFFETQTKCTCGSRECCTQTLVRLRQFNPGKTQGERHPRLCKPLYRVQFPPPSTGAVRGQMSNRHWHVTASICIRFKILHTQKQARVEVCSWHKQQNSSPPGRLFGPHVLIPALRSLLIIPYSREKYFIHGLSACDTAASIQRCADLLRSKQSTNQLGFFLLFTDPARK